MKLYRIAVPLLALAALGAGDQRTMRRDMLVAAAASLSGIAPHLTREFHEVSGIDVRFNFAGSNTLARQIVEGARVDVFVSADAAQMDVVVKAGRVVAGTRADVVSNQLVVISLPTAPALRVDEIGAPAVRRIAMGDPQAVPAGVYGRRWLENIRLWGAVESKIVPLPTSPAVVAAVREGRADVGIVYSSDAWSGGSAVRVQHRVSASDAPPILYPAAAVVGGRIPLAREFIAFLRGARAQKIFAEAGFVPLAADK
jgi:molybdate transport system substrate-binding protein